MENIYQSELIEFQSYTRHQMLNYIKSKLLNIKVEENEKTKKLIFHQLIEDIISYNQTIEAITDPEYEMIDINYDIDDEVLELQKLALSLNEPLSSYSDIPNSRITKALMLFNPFIDSETEEPWQPTDFNQFLLDTANQKRSELDLKFTNTSIKTEISQPSLQSSLKPDLKKIFDEIPSNIQAPELKLDYGLMRIKDIYDYIKEQKEIILSKIALKDNQAANLAYWELIAAIKGYNEDREDCMYDARPIDESDFIDIELVKLKNDIDRLSNNGGLEDIPQEDNRVQTHVNNIVQTSDFYQIPKDILIRIFLAGEFTPNELKQIAFVSKLFRNVSRNTEVLKNALKHISIEKLHNLLLLNIARNDQLIVDILLSDKRINLTEKEFLKFACSFGDTDITNMLVRNILADNNIVDKASLILSGDRDALVAIEPGMVTLKQARKLLKEKSFSSPFPQTPKKSWKYSALRVAIEEAQQGNFTLLKAVCRLIYPHEEIQTVNGKLVLKDNIAAKALLEYVINIIENEAYLINIGEIINLEKMRKL